MTRPELIDYLATRISEVQKPHPVRVAIDGGGGAGKTMLANELVSPVRRMGRSVIRASIDGFHNPRSVRYQRGRGSSEGYFRDSFNVEELASTLLIPLGPEGSLRYRPAIFDYRTDSEMAAPVELAAADAIVLFDGVLLHQTALQPHWDFSIFVHTQIEISFSRMAQRDGSSPHVDAEENRRYVEGERLYHAECAPKALADVVVDNSDLENPVCIG